MKFLQPNFSSTTFPRVSYRLVMPTIVSGHKVIFKMYERETVDLRLNIKCALTVEFLN